MAVVRIVYSTPLYNRGELLSGELSSEVLGYKNTCLTIQTHVTVSGLAAALQLLAPSGFYLTAHPQVSFTPPKVKMYQIVSTAENYSRTPAGFVIERPTGDVAYTGE